MKLSFKNRIALNYMVATALIVALVYALVYSIVETTVYQNIDRDLSYEARKHTTEITIVSDSIFFINKGEWEEREHREAQVVPVFIQVMNSRGQLMDKSPNLKGQRLQFENDHSEAEHFNSRLNLEVLRQVQIPIHEKGKLKGYIIAAMSLSSSLMVIHNLRNVLLISFPLVLLGLFFITRYLAGRSISPVREITETTNRINNQHLNQRVPLPPNRDELYELSASINQLLERLERAFERERQFTSDASHELRTPLASLRGTLEVLIRKERSVAEYEDKVRYSLGEIDRMADLTDQLLTMARMESAGGKLNELAPAEEVVETALHHFYHKAEARNIQLKWEAGTFGNFAVPRYYYSLILENLISNALKYSHENGRVRVELNCDSDILQCRVSDDGIGIKESDLEKVFQPFFRSDATGHRAAGTGLGLSIVKKAADAIGAIVTVESKIGEGSVFNVILSKS
ncbi:MAG: two-component sensor histidine kinase [Owenweeksia sp.]|nr:two-component sensor histidine kinase [Owenweeksia sp.]MBF98444.1 two-component sensor histidine kinase [Owenweeksia sp.]|tara:strand:- start:7947 stop:9323 length:1377 start_codon:yes stop_codon:yes gene_type:complete